MQKKQLLFVFFLVLSSVRMSLCLGEYEQIIPAKVGDLVMIHAYGAEVCAALLSIVNDGQDCWITEKEGGAKDRYAMPRMIKTNQILHATNEKMPEEKRQLLIWQLSFFLASNPAHR